MLRFLAEEVAGAAYKRAKKLEYEWAEPMTNPPDRVDGTKPSSTSRGR